jgi:hypothetical protein
MDIGSLTFGGLVMGGRSLVGRQDRIFGGEHHGGALVIWPLRMLGEILALSTNFEFSRRKKTFLFRVFRRPAIFTVRSRYIWHVS